MNASRTRIKLCGLRTTEQAVLAVSLGVDFIGLVFAESSRRRVTVEEARHVLEGAGPGAGSLRRLEHAGIPPDGWFQRCARAFDALLAQRRPLVVGVFGNQPSSLINAIAEAVPLDLLQLSGGGSWEQALELHRPVIMAAHIGPGTTAPRVIDRCEVGTAALCLLDTAIAGHEGGSGMAFDWSVAAAVGRRLPIILAGGLTPENVAAAVQTVRPWAVDVSSGIESHGSKDFAMMQAFVEAVRAADALPAGSALP